MAKTVRVSFLQMYCRETTMGVGSDELYLAAVPILVRKRGSGAEKRELRVALTTVRRDVTAGTTYQPTLPNGLPYFDVIVEEPDDEALVVGVALYEEDDGKHYETLREAVKPDLAGQPAESWGEVTDYLPKDPTSWVGWLQAVIKLAGKLIRNLMNDDYIGEYRVSIDFAKPASLGYRQLDFHGGGGEFRLIMHVQAT